mmetsp:Transcript_33634/g.104165  ORF Transcript_33634/g.104165 Transcript_33634/m.104165 type:complete len:87 (-) Transcript_33634:46-306(-)
MATVGLKRFLNPAFYQTSAVAFGEMVTNTYLKKGVLAQPIVGLMVTLGGVGYFIEYAVLGQYHVAHKKEKIEAALKEYDAKHGGHH